MFGFRFLDQWHAYMLPTQECMLVHRPFDYTHMYIYMPLKAIWLTGWGSYTGLRLQLINNRMTYMYTYQLIKQEDEKWLTINQRGQACEIN